MIAVYNSFPAEKQRIWCTCTQKPLKNNLYEKTTNLMYLCTKTYIHWEKTTYVWKTISIEIQQIWYVGLSHCSQGKKPENFAYCKLESIQHTKKHSFIKEKLKNIHQHKTHMHIHTHTHTHTHKQAFFLNELWSCITFTHQLQPNTRKIIGKI